MPVKIDLRIGALFALSQFERRLLSQILYLSRSHGACFARDSYFEGFFSISKGTVRRKIKLFQECGLVTVFRELGCRLIRVNIKAIGQAVEELRSSLNIQEEELDDMSFKQVKKKSKKEKRTPSSDWNKSMEIKKSNSGQKRISKEEVKEAERLIKEIVEKFTA